MKGCSDFKETNKEDDNNDEELRPDSEHITPLSVALEIRYDVKSSEFVSENKNLELKLRSISIETDTPINTALPKKNYLHIKGDNQKGFNQFLSRFEITLKFYLLGNRILRSCFDCSHNSGAAVSTITNELRKELAGLTLEELSSASKVIHDEEKIQN
ncbi:hypothetical protein RhiirC2_852670 [Rhizophagus irregularis]|uniref:Uncharacterized protein n=1 Tax=Rhizophagus irregularis TaxID=588596 RepID=A0A2N1MYM2_9GLOM|nr:hypothetical protein RhiirC2_852670 [Rhizophagus irregularis]